MGVLVRLRTWWRRRAWSRSGGAPDAAGAAGVADGTTDYECAVCGTGLGDQDGPCPLCRSTDVVPVGMDADADYDDAGGDGAASGRAAVGRRQVTDDEASVERLRTLRAEGELLERYDDRWRPVDGGFRVETADGTRVVDSREEVVAMLRAEDGRRPPRS